MRYLKKQRVHTCVHKCDELEIIEYADSHFAGSPDDKSTFGYVFKLAGGSDFMGKC